MAVTPFAAEPTAIDGLWLLTMKQIGDDRGMVRELFRPSAFAAAGLPPLEVRQVNVTETRPGALRGMHAEAMWKLVTVAHGRVHAAWVDLREGSGRGTVVQRALGPGDQVLVPPGVGNGFQSLGDSPSQYVYAFTEEWVPGMAGDCCHPLDPALGIAWPLPPILSDKDAAQPPLAR